jgi:hypothetical protein
VEKVVGDNIHIIYLQNAVAGLYLVAKICRAAGNAGTYNAKTRKAEPLGLI